MYTRRSRAVLVVAALVCSAVVTTGITGGVGAGTAQAASESKCSVSGSSSKLVVKTDRGAVKGTTSNGVRTWKGVPFAAPPVGKLRWRAPAEHACWKGALAATKFGAPCPQLDNAGTVVGSEDCLKLNVWRPDTGTKPRAVMVFVHGGGHLQGSTAQVTGGVTLYDGATLASKGNVVVVTVEYRLGSLGWLADSALAASAKKPAGNYGLLDEIAALRWVKTNIGAFGGDPKRVLLFGESAGAVDTCLLMSSPIARGLFSRALVESGACVAADATTAKRAAVSFQEAAGCNTAAKVAACLRALPVDTVLKTLPGSIDLTSLGRPRYGPYIDGRVLASDPLGVIGAGKGNQMPVIVGSNEDESALFVRDVPDANAYATALANAVGPAVTEKILAQYPVTAYDSPLAAMIAATTDPRFTCSARNTVRALLEGQHQPVYRYYFTHTMDGGALRLLGAFHGLDLFFVFGHMNTQNYQPSAAETALSDAMIGYWSRFAATGNPNGGGAVKWPPAKTGADPYLGLDSTIAAGDGVRTAQCDFWDSLTG
ncbi:MAG: carboxylesterase family protein [Acidimicrobiia bacterium]